MLVVVEEDGEERRVEKVEEEEEEEEAEEEDTVVVGVEASAAEGEDRKEAEAEEAVAEDEVSVKEDASSFRSLVRRKRAADIGAPSVAAGGCATKRDSLPSACCCFFTPFTKQPHFSPPPLGMPLTGRCSRALEPPPPTTSRCDEYM